MVRSHPGGACLSKKGGERDQPCLGILQKEPGGIQQVPPPLPYPGTSAQRHRPKGRSTCCVYF